jgi:hypothetical protein
MSGALTPLPNKLSWRGAQLKNTGTTSSLPLFCQRWKVQFNEKEASDTDPRSHPTFSTLNSVTSAAVFGSNNELPL